MRKGIFFPPGSADVGKLTQVEVELQESLGIIWSDSWGGST